MMMMMFDVPEVIWLVVFFCFCFSFYVFFFFFVFHTNLYRFCWVHFSRLSLLYSLACCLIFFPQHTPLLAVVLSLLMCKSINCLHWYFLLRCWKPPTLRKYRKIHLIMISFKISLLKFTHLLQKSFSFPKPYKRTWNGGLLTRSFMMSSKSGTFQHHFVYPVSLDSYSIKSLLTL